MTAHSHQSSPSLPLLASSESRVVTRARKSGWPAICVDDALATVDRIFSATVIEEIRRTKIISVSEVCQGDVLAKDLRALRPHPSFRASIKDGYAVIASDGAGPRKVVGASFAEKGGSATKLGRGVCCRISTGAALWPGADAVVQVEDTKLIEHDGNEEVKIEILKAPRIGQDIREVGSDVALGETLLAAGGRLLAAEMGLLALSNERRVRVFERADVCVLSTGDELTDSAIEEEEHTANPTPSTAIRDTNRPVLCAMFRAENLNVHDFGIVEDAREKLFTALTKAFGVSDVVVVSGGVSMGEKDYLKTVLVEDLRFDVHFGRVWMKPGLPSTFASGRVGGRAKFAFGLPGNPASTFVTAHLFVLPPLRRMSGLGQFRTTTILVQASEDILLDNRVEFRRACFKRDNDSGAILTRGANAAAPLVECIGGSQISSRLASAKSANLLLKLPQKSEICEKILAGELMTALVIGLL